MRFVVAVFALLLAACSQPESASVQVLIGGTLLDGKGGTVDRPIIVVENGKIAAVGPQAHTPVPRGSRKTDTAGFTIRPEKGKTVEPGQPANLEIIDHAGAVSRKMIGGVWQ